MIREDRLLLADLGRLNTDVVPLAMRIIDEIATAEEHHAFAERLEAMARRLRAGATRVGQVIDGELVTPSSAQQNASPGAAPCRDL
ncbi:MAG TPA: hypothetical protein VFO16_10420 [Pseudonocardiaceae bacterium]|nr:hypothetical protein [Pseudonocardiaceae bacterium]